MLRKLGGDREMVDILALVLHHDEQAVLTAVELALTEGVPTKTHVLNLLHRLVDGKIIGGPSLMRTFIWARGHTAIETPNTWPHPTRCRRSQTPLSRGSHPYMVRGQWRGEPLPLKPRHLFCRKC